MARHLLLSIATAFLALAGIRAQAGGTRFTLSEPHMGTLFRIVLYAPDEATAKKAAQAAFARIAELDRIMSDYKPDSELMQLCKKAGGPAVEVSPDLFAILEKSLEFARESDGALDITVGPLVRLWRKARKSKELPNAAELAAALKLVDFRNIQLDPAKRTVRLLVAGILLDLGAIAKGYALEQAMAVLRRHGVTRALVAGGGDVVAGDPPPDKRPWKVGIAPLHDPAGTPTHYLALANLAVSTAGDAHQAVEIGGKRYSHIVDPKTGQGQFGRRSVSVIAPSGTTADALDTAACVLGKVKGLAMIERHQGVAALFVVETPNGIETTMSKRFAQHLWKD